MCILSKRQLLNVHKLLFSVLQRKLDEDELRRQVEELKRQAEAEERRRIEEAR